VPDGWTSIIFVQLIIGGIELLMIGVVGEYLARVYEEVKRRPTYVVRQAHTRVSGSDRSG
jgi:dolichol-phosphate mannosyltransferase